MAGIHAQRSPLLLVEPCPQVSCLGYLVHPGDAHKRSPWIRATCTLKGTSPSVPGDRGLPSDCQHDRREITPNG